MKAVKRSSNRKAGSSKRKGTARRPAHIRERTGSRAQQPASVSATAPYLHLKLRRSTKTEGESVRIRVPPVLLEGDMPGTPSPLERAIAPEPVVRKATVPGIVGALPEAYGTKRLKLTPRDPHWIHAHWDFTRQQLRAANAQSAEGHLVLRMFEQSTEGALISETPVTPEAVRWLVHVPRSATAYAAEIGFYNEQRQWSALAVADPVRTPPAGPSVDRGFEVATLTPSGQLQRHDPLETPQPPETPPGTGPALVEQALSSEGLGWPGPPGLEQAFPVPRSSFGVSSWSLAGVSSVSSPVGAAPEPSFRLEVDAELIVYGATTPDAILQIGNRIVPLNEDGTFRLRFALPDGAHLLPLKATAAGTGEQRAATLHFSRQTDTGANVAPAQPPTGLKPPGVENL